MANESRTNEVMSLIAGLPVAEDITRDDRPSLKEVESFFRNIIEARINHCVDSLKAHASVAKVAFNVVVWKDGHFSIPVYEALVEAQNQDWRDWNPLIWQQIIRHMAEDSCKDNMMFCIATEFMLVTK
jgi:hypothetical protein